MDRAQLDGLPTTQLGWNQALEEFRSWNKLQTTSLSLFK